MSAPPPPATSTAPGAGSGTVTVTEADSGKSVMLHLGDRLEVQLASPSIYIWTEPASSDESVLCRTSGSSGATAKALFVATINGRSTVTATDNPTCYPACLPPSRLFEVSVSVMG